MKSLHGQLLYELKTHNVQVSEIDSLFIGGGTPSTIDPLLYQPIFDTLKPFLKKNAEITSEANPNSATKAWLEGMYKLGVNRISFGVQSFNQKKLKALNRAHSPEQAKKAIKNAKEIGFQNLSLDLIYNYQGDTKALLKHDLEEAFKLPINHISAYELTIEENTKFATTPTVRQENDELAFFVANKITEQGFEHYEISNFGSYQSVHNKGYWELKDYIGIGAGAVGFKNNTRYYPTTDINLYIKEPLTIHQEHLSDEDILTEKIFLGLRSNVGIHTTFLNESKRKKADFLVKEKKLNYKENTYYNSNYFIADELALYLLD
jgi:oxygen-independent coproporphyrinogen-3 oxidase